LDGLLEDPEDDPSEFILIIEQHNAGLEKSHLLLEATQTDIMQQKWEEGKTLDDIGKFLSLNKNTEKSHTTKDSANEFQEWSATISRTYTVVSINRL
jgi:hypothetical protein